MNVRQKEEWVTKLWYILSMEYKGIIKNVLGIAQYIECLPLTWEAWIPGGEGGFGGDG